MGGRIPIRLYPVAGACQHGPIRPKHHRAHGHLTPVSGGASFFKCHFHRSNHPFFLPGRARKV